MSYARPVKIYTVEIEPLPNKGVWYYDKTGKWFNCILVPKTTKGGEVSARFMVIECTEDAFNLPVVYHTIRPEDCRVVMERIVYAGITVQKFIRLFGKQEGKAA